MLCEPTWSCHRSGVLDAFLGAVDWLWRCYAGTQRAPAVVPVAPVMLPIADLLLGGRGQSGSAVQILGNDRSCCCASNPPGTSLTIDSSRTMRRASDKALALKEVRAAILMPLLLAMLRECVVMLSPRSHPRAVHLQRAKRLLGNSFWFLIPASVVLSTLLLLTLHFLQVEQTMVSAAQGSQ